MDREALDEPSSSGERRGPAAEQLAENPNRKEEAVPTGDPLLAIGRDTAAGNHAVDMGTQLELLAPGVLNGQAADPSPEMVWVGGDP